MIKYKCESEKSRFSNIGQQWEKAIWFKRNLAKHQNESILLILTDSWCSISIRVNGIDLTGLIEPTNEQIAEIMDSSTSIAEVFDYCRKHFCRELAPVKPNVRPAKVDDQLDMFEVMA